MPDTPKSCASCKFYREIDYGYGRKPHMECDGLAADYVFADADDDSGLTSSFRPPPQFCCNGYKAKE